MQITWMMNCSSNYYNEEYIQLGVTLLGRPYRLYRKFQAWFPALYRWDLALVLLRVIDLLLWIGIALYLANLSRPFFGGRIGYFGLLYSACLDFFDFPSSEWNTCCMAEMKKIKFTYVIGQNILRFFQRLSQLLYPFMGKIQRPVCFI